MRTEGRTAIETMRPAFRDKPPVVKWAIYFIAGFRVRKIPIDSDIFERNQGLIQLKQWLVNEMHMDAYDLLLVRRAVGRRFGGADA